MRQLIIISTSNATVILTGDTNIKIKEDPNIQKQYTELLQNFNLIEDSQLPTRKGIKNVDHIITIIQNEIIYSNVLPRPSISDHDALYIVTKISIPKYQIRYKFIRDMKEFDMARFQSNSFFNSLFVILMNRKTDQTF